MLLSVKQRFEPGENSLDANDLFMSEKNIQVPTSGKSDRLLRFL